MFQQLLFVQWKSARFGVLPFVVLAFGLPLLAVQGLGTDPLNPDAYALAAGQIMSRIAGWVPVFPLLAALTGIVAALSAWTWDHKVRHVYALSLPVDRRRYVLLKMGAGVVLLLVPCVAFWIGALLATSAVEIPEGLRAYPTAVAVRFALTALVLYAILFAMAAGTLRTTVWVLIGLAVLLVSGGFLADFLGQTLVPSLQGVSFMSWILDRALDWPGPFEVITGNWMLFDV
jgi:hypothetical protein